MARPRLDDPARQTRFPDPTQRTIGALCHETGIDPDLWFSEGRSGIEDAKRVCSACPVLDACRAYGIETRQEFGVWGGLTARERFLMRRRAFRAAREAAASEKAA